jgi:hypothetical protein
MNAFYCSSGIFKNHFMTALAAFKIIFIQQDLSFRSLTASGKRQTSNNYDRYAKEKSNSCKSELDKVKSTDLESY